MEAITTHTLGYPRIGEKRELKRATEAYWKGNLSLEELEAAGAQLRATNWAKQASAGIHLVPVGDFSFYDQMLDTTCMLGAVPARFKHTAGAPVNLDTLFLMARGAAKEASANENETANKKGDENGHESDTCCSTATDAAPMYACEMTKWFDTNYHYMVPELSANTQFTLSTTKLVDEFKQAQALGSELGFTPKPTLIGPLTYLKLSKAHAGEAEAFSPLQLMDSLVSVYSQVIAQLGAAGAQYLQLDEPILATDCSESELAALSAAHKTLHAAARAAGMQTIAATYFGPLQCTQTNNHANLNAFLALPADVLHIDAVRGPDDIPWVLEHFPENKTLSVGIVNGRNIWKNDFTASLKILEQAHTALGGGNRLWVASSCSLMHSPVTLKNESKESVLDAELKNWMAFADEKLTEIATLAELLNIQIKDKDAAAAHPALQANAAAHAARTASTRIHNAAVAQRTSSIQPADYNRASPFKARQTAQRKALNLPPFPTTTIGSFPQTKAVRSARAAFKKGTLSEADYTAFLQKETAACVQFQNEIGIDMPVHGEFERTDMVEYFGEHLGGFTFTQHGWVQSYGSRYVKPPVIFGDVHRSQPITVAWSTYAKSLTTKPMKGMLTGPITILQWSFVRDDQPRSTTASQIALAIKDEVLDLEAAGIAAIQIDEPALREGLPLKRSAWAAYLQWATGAFRLSAAAVKDATQIHTHMCYCEFNDIIADIAALDADVITIETSRSNMELLEAFATFHYPNEIGPGVYDIHSPRVPSTEEMIHLMRRAAQYLPKENLWVNPDCGLKTRGWPETKASLQNMVACAKQLRTSAW